jgi:hypothetical protein
MSVDEEPELPVCRVCGCTDSMACTWFEVLGNGSTKQMSCHWAAKGLCSECAPAPAPEPLLFDAHGAPLVFR